MNDAITGELWQAFQDHVIWLAAALLVVSVV